MEAYEQLKMFMTGDEIRAEYEPSEMSPNPHNEPVILSYSDKVVLDGEAIVMYADGDQLIPVLYED